MPIELHCIGLIVVFYGVTYLLVYPRIKEKSLMALMRYDAVAMIMLLGMAWWLYAGSGLRFSLLFFQTNWFVFTLVMALLIEMPFTLWFCRKWGIDLRGGR